jgi:hypothetical protein
MLARLARLSAALLLAVASVVLLGSAPAHACRCVFGDVARQVDRADAVFVGSFARPDRTVADGRITFDLAVDEVYRGEVTSPVTVVAPYSSATCGLDGIPAGKPVVWFVRGAPRGEVRSDLCSGTTPLTPALSRRLERLAGPPGPPVTSGPLVESGGGIDAGGGAADDSGDSGSAGASGSADSTGDQNEDTSGLFHGGLPWWAWGAVGLGVLAGAAAALRRGLRT